MTAIRQEKERKRLRRLGAVRGGKAGSVPRQEIWNGELSRHRLLGYAESFRRLAHSLHEENGQESERAAEIPTDRAYLLEQQHLRESKLMLGSNLEEMAGILRQLAGELISCRPVEERYRRLILHAFRSESIFAEEIGYLTTDAPERRTLALRLRTEQPREIPTEEIADMLSVLLRRPLLASAASPAAVDGVARRFLFLEEPRYIALTGFCKVTKENETVSGDQYSVLESEHGRATLLLSDGTGSGESASRDSERVLDLVEQFLEAGYSPEAAARMVNTAIYARGQEYSHPTLDVCDIDLYEGSCAFLKVGGAASFVKRGATIRQIDGAGMPLGLLRTMEIEPVRHTLESGDYVILVTDGVLDALDSEDGWAEQIRRSTAGLEDAGPGELAEAIIRAALCAAGGHVRDDMTVLVGGIWERE